MSSLHFDGWRFDPDLGRLTRGSESHHLRPQTGAVLELLLSRRGKVVTRDELRALLWPGNVVVDFDTGINSCVKQIRAALGESAAAPVYLHTVPKKGFRFVVPDPEPRRRGAAARWGVIGGGALVLLIAVVLRTTTPWPDRPAPERVVAILPFDDLAATDHSARLQQIILDDLIRAVGMQDEARVAVIARRSVLAIDDDVAADEIGRSLGATHILDGTIRPLADGYMVSVSLVGADNRFVWGELFEISAADSEPGLGLLRDAAVQEMHLEAHPTR
ncbi:MAG: winged helix-turn-helix domain-containing protein [Pseudomonadota bacterium]